MDELSQQEKITLVEKMRECFIVDQNSWDQEKLQEVINFAKEKDISHEIFNSALMEACDEESDWSKEKKERQLYNPK